MIKCYNCKTWVDKVIHIVKGSFCSIADTQERNAIKSGRVRDNDPRRRNGA